jgi:hypothetical protein
LIAQRYQPIRLWKWKWAQQHAIHHREDRCARSNAERKHQHGGDCESRRLAKLPPYNAKVRIDSVH